jgi:hypothetical protein
MSLGKAQDARVDVEKCREIAVETRTGKACVKMLGSTFARGPGHQ